MALGSNVALPIVLRTLAHASITTSFVAVGAAMTNSLRMFRLVNNTDGDMIFSLDGTNNHFFVPASSFVLYDIAANSGIDSNFRIANQTQFYVLYSTAPSKNSVYVEAIYGKGE